MTLDEPALINNNANNTKSSFLQNLKNAPPHQMFLDSDNNSSPCHGAGETTQIMMKSIDKMHYPRGDRSHNQSVY